MASKTAAAAADFSTCWVHYFLFCPEPIGAKMVVLVLQIMFEAGDSSIRPRRSLGERPFSTVHSQRGELALDPGSADKW